MQWATAYQILPYMCNPPKLSACHQMSPDGTSDYKLSHVRRHITCRVYAHMQAMLWH